MHLRSERYSVVPIPSNEYLNIGNKSEYSVVVVYSTCSYPVTIRFILKILMNYYRRFASGTFHELVANMEIEYYIENTINANFESYLNNPSDVQDKHSKDLIHSMPWALSLTKSVHITKFLSSSTVPFKIFASTTSWLGNENFFLVWEI